MSEPITITVTAQTAQAAAELRQFVAQTTGELAVMQQTVAAAGSNANGR